ncbi:hypothetical protein BN1723_011589 [Verticillium longisporum]|uniref:Uncharacterized protein n=1 Tax=Verticillium longisporum TaxID=100787 RepID=A0A0G4L9V2_VERLO|nr:hypothetical protein BN1708_011790 [Verticillium longisporum]CRK18485.1 hypothetical protein BN1723_011589 [Verticillium longisporum]
MSMLLMVDDISESQLSISFSWLSSLYRFQLKSPQVFIYYRRNVKSSKVVSNKRVMLITGANSGVGYDTSHILANASADNHVIMAARSETKGRKALLEI